MTSDFHPVQAKGHSIAMQYSIPVFWAGMYKASKAGEVIFFQKDYGLRTYKEIAHNRYDNYDTNKDVSKDGTKRIFTHDEPVKKKILITSKNNNND